MISNQVITLPQIICPDHQKKCIVVHLTPIAPRKFLCSACLNGKFFTDLADIDEVFSFEAISQLERKKQQQHLQNSLKTSKIQPRLSWEELTLSLMNMQNSYKLSRVSSRKLALTLVIANESSFLTTISNNRLYRLL